MASDRQLRANRANAQKSTGPRSVEGKLASSRNAISHGMTSLRVVLDGEDATLYQAMITELVEEFRPTTAFESTLIQQLANVIWRLRRSIVYEAALFAWIAHLQSQAHDATGVVLGQVFLPLNAAGLSSEDRDKQHTPDFANSANSLLRTGRTLEAMLNKNELLSRLSRYETHLVRQLDRLLCQLAANRKHADRRDGCQVSGASTG